MPPLLPAMSGRGAYWGPHPMPPDTQGSRINMRLALGFTHEKPEDESDTKPRNFGASLALRKRLFSNQAAWLSGGPSHQSDLMREPWPDTAALRDRLRALRDDALETSRRERGSVCRRSCRRSLGSTGLPLRRRPVAQDARWPMTAPVSSGQG